MTRARLARTDQQPLPRRTGVAIGLFAASGGTTPFDIQRAPDDAGAPDEPNAEMIATNIPPDVATYLDPLPDDGVPRWYRVRAARDGHTASAWLDWVQATPKVFAGSVHRPPPRLPTIGWGFAETATQGTLTATVTDPQLRVVSVEFNTKIGHGAWTGWVEDATEPYEATVALADGHNAKIQGRITYYDEQGILRVEETPVFTFDAGNTANVQSATITLSGSGEAIAGASGDTDTVKMYVLVGLNAPPGDPTAGANDGTIVGQHGSVSTGVFADPGDLVYLSVAGENDQVQVGPTSQFGPVRREDAGASTVGNYVTVGTPKWVPDQGRRANLRIRIPSFGDDTQSLTVAYTKNGTPESYTINTPAGNDMEFLVEDSIGAIQFWDRNDDNPTISITPHTGLAGGGTAGDTRGATPESMDVTGEVGGRWASGASVYETDRTLVSQGILAELDGSNRVVVKVDIPLAVDYGGTALRAADLTAGGILRVDAAGTGWEAHGGAALAGQYLRRGASVAEFSDLLAADLTGTITTAVQDNITRVGTLAAGAVPASLVTPGAFGGSAAYTFPDNVILASTKRLYFDNGGDTFLFEAAANDLRIHIGNLSSYRVRFRPSEVHFQNQTLRALGTSHLGLSTSERWGNIFATALDLSGNATVGSLDLTGVGTSNGTLVITGGDGAVTLASSGTTGHVLTWTAAGFPDFAAANAHKHSGADIDSGVVGRQFGGTGADLSGGTGELVITGNPFSTLAPPAGSGSYLVTASGAWATATGVPATDITGSFATITVAAASPSYDLTETDQTDPAGRWRMRVAGDSWLLERRSSAGTWSSPIAALTIESTGLVAVEGGDGSTSAKMYVRSNMASGGYIALRDTSGTEASRGHFGWGSALLTGAASTDVILRSNAALKLTSNGNNLAVTFDTSQKATFVGDVQVGGNLVYSAAGTGGMLYYDGSTVVGISGSDATDGYAITWRDSNSDWTLTELATPSAIPVPVGEGGTGRSSLDVNEILAGGTTLTGNVQSISNGATSTVLMGNGASTLPSFQSLVAGDIGAGTFSAGSFTFPDAVSVGGALTVDADIKRSGTGGAIHLSGSTGSTSGAVYSLFGPTHGSLADVHRWRTDGTETMRLDASGDLYVYTGDIHAVAGFADQSSREIKHDFRPIIERMDPIAMLRKLEPMAFRYDVRPEVQRYGFIFENLPAPFRAPEKGIYYSHVTTALVCGWQDHDRRIETAEEKIERLENRVAELESRLMIAAYG